MIPDHYDEAQAPRGADGGRARAPVRRIAKLPGVTPFPSKANFVLARFPDSALVFDALKRAAFWCNLSAMHPLMANAAARSVSVGIPAEMDAPIKALKEIPQ